MPRHKSKTLKRRTLICQKHPKKFIHKGFSWNLRGPVDKKVKSFVLASCGVDTSETYQKLIKFEGEEPYWEELAIQIVLGQELASQPLRKKGRITS